MAGATFIGDELTGAGFRLAGLRVYTPSPAQIPEIFRQVLNEDSLLLITGSAAAQLPPAEVAQAIARAAPPVYIVPGVRDDIGISDLAREVRTTLGMET